MVGPSQSNNRRPIRQNTHCHSSRTLHVTIVGDLNLLNPPIKLGPVQHPSPLKDTCQRVNKLFVRFISCKVTDMWLLKVLSPYCSCGICIYRVNGLNRFRSRYFCSGIYSQVLLLVTHTTYRR